MENDRENYLASIHTCTHVFIHSLLPLQAEITNTYAYIHLPKELQDNLGNNKKRSMLILNPDSLTIYPGQATGSFSDQM